MVIDTFILSGFHGACSRCDQDWGQREVVGVARSRSGYRRRFEVADSEPGGCLCSSCGGIVRHLAPAAGVICSFSDDSIIVEHFDPVRHPL